MSEVSIPRLAVLSAYPRVGDTEEDLAAIKQDLAKKFGGRS